MTLTHLSAELANIRCKLVYAEKKDDVKEAVLELIDLMHKQIGDVQKEQVEDDG
jgi:hypothetical protein